MVDRDTGRGGRDGGSVTDDGNMYPDWWVVEEEGACRGRIGEVDEDDDDRE